MLSPIIDEPGTPGNEMWPAALDYHRRGWTVIPTVGKKPPEKMPWKKYQTARPDEATLRRLFSRNGITGLAVLLGSASGGLACRDFDCTDGYERWADAHPDLATVLPIVRTARGFHVYCRSVGRTVRRPRGRRVPCGLQALRSAAALSPSRRRRSTNGSIHRATNCRSLTRNPPVCSAWWTALSRPTATQATHGNPGNPLQPTQPSNPLHVSHVRPLMR